MTEAWVNQAVTKESQVSDIPNADALVALGAASGEEVLGPKEKAGFPALLGAKGLAGPAPPLKRPPPVMGPAAGLAAVVAAVPENELALKPVVAGAAEPPKSPPGLGAPAPNKLVGVLTGFAADEVAAAPPPNPPPPVPKMFEVDEGAVVVAPKPDVASFGAPNPAKPVVAGAAGLAVALAPPNREFVDGGAPKGEAVPPAPNPGVEVGLNRLF